jgi:DNA-binding transcriptional LysR family regulator
MDFAQLETFLVIAREKSFTRAAERLYRTQPAISLALKRLEDDLGETLVDRSSKGGVLTSAGETLLPLAQRMLDLAQEIRDTFGDLKGLHTGRLSIGANESMSVYLLPRLLMAYRGAHPDIRLQAFRFASERIPEEVLERRLDVGFLSFEPLHPELQSEVIVHDQMVLVVPPGHALAKRRSVPIQALGQETFVAHYAMTPARRAVVDAFAQHEVPLRITMELATLATIQDFVAAGAGLAILPRLTVREAVREGRLVEVAVPQLKVDKTIRMVHRREETLSPAAKAFLALVRRQDFDEVTASPRRTR